MVVGELFLIAARTNAATTTARGLGTYVFRANNLKAAVESGISEIEKRQDLPCLQRLGGRAGWQQVIITMASCRVYVHAKNFQL